ncbi:hypothetical protein K2173_021417 [Erythroxylum novogranatense]|uniref:Homeobox-leucine zipper protein n=1 Tax=Erythroxylum novogranatense TaxID=1862640 RepID=A0AAV8TV08_9ROSI|nr:hypothetical protein K2173_021417 [Erythroxylum novogranatense]
MSGGVDDHVLLLSQLYPEVYSEMLPHSQGELKSRRRRKKNKAGDPAGIFEIKKRKLTAEQVKLLEVNFDNEHKLESQRKDKLASELGLDPRQVAVWFQNRRVRWKNKKLEDEYTKLKSSHDSIVVEKCRLESEVLKLKEQLSEAEKQIQQLSEPGSSNSSTSSLSMEASEPPLFGEFGIEDYGDVFYTPGSSYINGLGWVNL